MKNSKTATILIISILVTILIGFSFLYFSKFIKNKDQHVSDLTLSLEEKMQEKENATVFAEKFKEIELIRDSINGYFIDSKNVDKFVDYLEKIGSDLGSDLLVKNVEISTKKENTVSFKVSITGTFQKVMDTISFLENIPYQINITQIYLNKNTKEQNQSDIIKNKKQNGPSWQAEVSFEVLSQN